MSEITGAATAHEAYAFACMRCGHGWEQAYDIEHHADTSGKSFVVYKSEGVRVPSPLSSPNCNNCGGHVIRIMKSGQVSSARAFSTPQYTPPRAPRTERGKAEGPVVAERQSGALTPDEVHHWRLSDLLHPFHFHNRRG